MTTSTITRERLEEIAKDGFLKHGESKKMARMALGAMDSKPVAWDYEWASCITCEGPQGFKRIIEREAPPEWAIVEGQARNIIPLYRHVQPAPVIPTELHPDTQKLVIDFCTALAEKLYKAQLKYGYDADWKQDGWPSQCQAHFHQHVAKGDPRDVAAYCAFMWYHGWKTEAAQPAPVVLDEHAAFNAWNNDVDCPLAGRDAKSAAWMAWNYRAMLQAAPVCTCPSGDGSLRWPCPSHPGNSPVIPGCDGAELLPSTGEVIELNPANNKLYTPLSTGISITKEMIIAGQEELEACIDNGFDSDADGNRHDYTAIASDTPYRVFRAMLAAAQQEVK